MAGRRADGALSFSAACVCFGNVSAASGLSSFMLFGQTFAAQLLAAFFVPASFRRRGFFGRSVFALLFGIVGVGNGGRIGDDYDVLVYKKVD